MQSDTLCKLSGERGDANDLLNDLDDDMENINGVPMTSDDIQGIKQKLYKHFNTLYFLLCALCALCFFRSKQYGQLIR